jgi:hypothetical protein
MKDESIANFGLLIAYVIPGCVILWGVGEASPSVGVWFGAASANSATLGGFLYVTLAAVAAGLTASTLRWLVIDAMHHYSGIKPPRWDFSALDERVEALDFLIELHYRYYQFYANTLVASLFAYVAWRLNHWASAPWGWPELLAIAFWALFFLGSRDTLTKYYARTKRLMERPHG